MGVETAVQGQTEGDKETAAPVRRPSVVSSKERAAEAEEGTAGDDSDGPEETYPEGGREAWLVVLGCWFGLTSSLGLMNTIATFQTYVSTHQLAGRSPGEVGWVFSLYTFLSFFLGVYVGPLFDLYGPRWLVAAGTLCVFLGLMLLSISTGESRASLSRLPLSRNLPGRSRRSVSRLTGPRAELWHFILSFGVLAGLGSALLFTPCFAAVGHFFKRRRGLATGIAATGSGLGGVVFPLLLQALFPRVGWAWAVRAVALVCLVLAGLANLLVRSRLAPAAGASAHPDPRILRRVPFALTTLGTFLLEFGLFVPLGYVSLYALARGFGDAFSFQILAVLNSASVVGRVLPGWYADRVGAFNVNMLGVLVSVVACLAVWLPAGGTTAGLVVFSVLFGFASGGNISLTPVCIGQLCATNEYGRY